MQEATAALRGLLEALQSAPGPVVQVDASPLRELDTAAISVLLQYRRRVHERGLMMQLNAVPAKLAALMALYGVSDLFGVDGLSANPAGSGAP
ncbi:MAG: hypothetical protein RL500_2063 [Pseudomonadota bacterium]|jgi:ABC-type transporter Mla MlaB component